MAEPTYRDERRIESCAAYGVVDEIEAATVGVLGDVVLDRCGSVVNRNGSEPFNESQVLGRARRENFRAERASELNGDVTDATGPTLDQYFLTGLYLGTIYQSLPGRDEYQRQGSSLTHR